MALNLPDTDVLRYKGSFVQLRWEIDQKHLMDGEEAPRMVVYVPMAQDQTHHALIELESAGVIMQPGQQPPARNTRLAVVARNALKGVLGEGTAAHVEKQTEAGKLTLVDLDAALATINPSLDTINHEIAVAPTVFDTYAAAAPDLVKTVDNATRISDTIVDQNNNLDTLLVSAIGLADVGTEVLSTNRQPLADVVHLLAPTTDLLNEYNAALTCGIGGLVPLATGPGTPLPGVTLLQSFFLGRERYRYPSNLPKVAAKGGPQCTDLPKVPYEKSAPYVVTDIGASAWP